MPDIKKTIPVEIPVTPSELGALFAEMPSGEQAEFFSAAAQFIKDKYPGGSGSFCMQMQYVTDEDSLTDDARAVMRIIGDYSGQGD